MRSLVLRSLVLVVMLTFAYGVVSSVEAPQAHAAPASPTIRCVCPPKHAPWVHNLSHSARGHLVRRVWKWIPGYWTKHSHFYPAHWTCNKRGQMRWRPAHWTHPHFVPGHWGWVYSAVR